mmetsp:Transcript_70048/g.141055  ORF Transcript_70048/g.141055 Transcript_70048/m.141055 type:complete len:83 (-) Transcript_70048:513-761(-)
MGHLWKQRSVGWIRLKSEEVGAAAGVVEEKDEEEDAVVAAAEGKSMGAEVAKLVKVPTPKTLPLQRQKERTRSPRVILFISQ